MALKGSIIMHNGEDYAPWLAKKTIYIIQAMLSAIAAYGNMNTFSDDVFIKEAQAGCILSSIEEEIKVLFFANGRLNDYNKRVSERIIRGGCNEFDRVIKEYQLD